MFGKRLKRAVARIISSCRPDLSFWSFLLRKIILQESYTGIKERSLRLACTIIRHFTNITDNSDSSAIIAIVEYTISSKHKVKCILDYIKFYEEFVLILTFIMKKKWWNNNYRKYSWHEQCIYVICDVIIIIWYNYDVIIYVYMVFLMYICYQKPWQHYNVFLRKVYFIDHIFIM